MEYIKLLLWSVFIMQSQPSYSKELVTISWNRSYWLEHLYLEPNSRENCGNKLTLSLGAVHKFRLLRRGRKSLTTVGHAPYKVCRKWRQRRVWKSSKKRGRDLWMVPNWCRLESQEFYRRLFRVFCSHNFIKIYNPVVWFVSKKTIN